MLLSLGVAVFGLLALYRGVKTFKNKEYKTIERFSFSKSTRTWTGNSAKLMGTYQMFAGSIILTYGLSSIFSGFKLNLAFTILLILFIVELTIYPIARRSHIRNGQANENI